MSASQQDQLLRHKLPLPFLFQQMEQRVWNRRVLRDGVIHLCFLAVYIWFAFLEHSADNTNYYGEQSLERTLYHQPLPLLNPAAPGNGNATQFPYYDFSFHDMSVENDIYDNLEGVIIPKLFPTDDPIVTSNRSRTINGGFILLSTLRIRTKHMKNDSCDVVPTWYPTNKTQFPRVCYRAHDVNYELKGPLCPPFPSSAAPPICFNHNTEECSLAFQSLAGLVSTYECGGHIVDIPFNTSRTAALAIARGTIRQGRLMYVPSMRFYAVEFMAYHISTNLFYSVKLIVEVASGGGFTVWPRIRNFKVANFDARQAASTAAIVAFVAYYLVRFIADAMQFVREKALEDTFGVLLIRFFFDLWNFMQLVNLLVFLALFVFTGVYVTTSFLILSGGLPLDRAVVPGLHNFALETFVVLQYLNSVNTVIVFSFLIKYMAAINRFGVVHRAIGRAVFSVVPVLVVFFIVVVAYSIAGTLLYGHAFSGFRDMGHALASNFRIVMLNFDYDALYDENWILTPVYFWSFVILAVFITGNFIVAVMMSAFSKEVNATKQRSTVAALVSIPSSGPRYFLRSVITWVTCSQSHDDIVLAALQQDIERQRSELLNRAEVEEINRALDNDDDDGNGAPGLLPSAAGSEGGGGASTVRQQDDSEMVGRLATYAVRFGPTLTTALRHVVGVNFSRSDLLHCLYRAKSLYLIGDDFIDSLWLESTETFIDSTSGAAAASGEEVLEDAEDVAERDFLGGIQSAVRRRVGEVFAEETRRVLAHHRLLPRETDRGSAPQALLNSTTRTSELRSYSDGLPPAAPQLADVFGELDERVKRLHRLATTMAEVDGKGGAQLIRRKRKPRRHAAD